MKRVVLYDVYHGTRDRAHIIYAHVRDADTGEIEISATLDYCLEAISERGWTIVKV